MVQTISISDDASSRPTVMPTDQRPWVFPLVVLTAVYTFNSVDRLIFNVLAEQIKQDLNLKDWHLGVLTGLSFSLIYALASLPIARFAERTHRPRLIACALVVWSSFTIACSFARSFGTLAAARLGVGLGESAFSPAAYSLVADTVPAQRRSFAFGVFYSAMPIGTLIAMAIGGVIADQWGWRAALPLAGVPGLLLAPVLWWMVKDPRYSVAAAMQQPARDFRADVRALWRKRSFILLVVAQGLYSVTGYGTLAFVTSFYLRNHVGSLDTLATIINGRLGTDLAQVGVLGPVLGILGGLAGIFGAIASGAITDRLVRRDPRHFGFMGAIPQIIAFPLFVGTLFTPYLGVSLFLLTVYLIFQAMPGPAFWSAVQGLSPVETRATATALSLFTIVLVGNGFGPLLIGAASDLMVGLAGNAGSALRWALIVGQIPAFIAMACFLLSRRHLRGDFID
ncbi:MFS transporter [Sphingobium sp.]|uniref:spinster family MFS transporter n=1 Tax=Sphingobium sp. TaxID=1912891 RepID=UPI002C101C75|nr:MFS transporter [Sphingobium sp.]HUD93008.1 MFS transporter [Sphingobium sp.]